MDSTKESATIRTSGYKHFCLDIRDKDMYPELRSMQIVINNAGTQNEMTLT